MIRVSSNSYVISVRGGESLFRHLKVGSFLFLFDFFPRCIYLQIEHTTDGCYKIAPTDAFSSIPALVAHYSQPVPAIAKIILGFDTILLTPLSTS